MVEANIAAGYLSLAKYARKEMFLHADFELKATRMLAQCLKCMQGSRIIHDLDRLKELATGKSSPGFPWNLRYSKKSTLFGDHSFDEYFKWFHESRLKGIRVPAVYVNSVKRELKDQSKVLMNNVRTYTAGPVQLTLEGYSYFADQNSKLVQAANELSIPVTAGLQKFAGGWNRLYNALNRFPNAGMMDISSYDSGLGRKMFDRAYQVRKSCLSADQSELLAVDQYMEDVVASYILCDGGEIVQKQTGNPSGQTNTISDNCLILLWAFFYAWSLLKPNDYDATWYEFNENVVLFVCGDDSIYTVSDDIKDWYNPAAIQEVFESFGWKFKIQTPDFMKLDDTEYCSMQWVKHGRMVFPKPSTSKMLSSLVFKGRSESLRMTFLRACALRIECWYNKECVEILNGLCQWLLFNYRDVMERLPITEMDPFSFDEVLLSYLSSFEIEELYIGGENHNVGLRPIIFEVSLHLEEYSILAELYELDKQIR
jgi:hypothetical protein